MPGPLLEAVANGPELRRRAAGGDGGAAEPALVGIVTERDVVGALVDGLDAHSTAVSACMTPQPISASPEKAVSEAAFRMVNAGARHPPVVEHGRLVGILSARDLLVLHLSERSAPAVAAR